MKIDSEVACGKQHYCMYKYVLHPTFGKLLVSWTRKGREGGVMKGWERAKSKHVTHLDDGLERKESVCGIDEGDRYWGHHVFIVPRVYSSPELGSHDSFTHMTRT